jgi:hypothetical protein
MTFDEREEASMEFDSVIDDMLTDQAFGGSLVAQAFVDYLQALINADIVETDGSDFFQLLENATLSTEYTDINVLVQNAMNWRALQLITF